MTHADLYLENDEIFARWNYKVSSVRSVSIFPDKSDLYHYEIVKHYGVQVFSTNMQLYAAMSQRVTNILRKSIHHVENYSIDESFCDLKGYDTHFDLVELMRGVRERIKLWTDIPVSVGIAPSKTLAKMGSKFAKQYKRI